MDRTRAASAFQISVISALFLGILVPAATAPATGAPFPGVQETPLRSAFATSPTPIGVHNWGVDDWNMGYGFTPTVDGDLTALGANCAAGARTVRLYDAATGEELSSVVVTTTSAGTWTYESIAPAHVVAGKTYVVAVRPNGLHDYCDAWGFATPRNSGHVRIVETRWDHATDAMPTQGANDRLYGIADVVFEPALSSQVPAAPQIPSAPGTRPTGVSAGDDRTCVLWSDGNVTCRRWQYWTHTHEPVQGYQGGDAVGVSVGSELMCVVTRAGNVTCRDFLGIFGESTMSYANFTAVSVGNQYACALTSDHNVDCWNRGGMSLGQIVQYMGGRALAVSAGNSETCLLLAEPAPRGVPGIPGPYSERLTRVECHGYHDRRVAVWNLSTRWANALSSSASTGTAACALQEGEAVCDAYNGVEDQGKYLGDLTQGLFPQPAGVAFTSASGLCVLAATGDVTCSAWDAANRTYTQRVVYQGHDGVALTTGYSYRTYITHSCVLTRASFVSCWSDDAAEGAWIEAGPAIG